MQILGAQVRQHSLLEQELQSLARGLEALGGFVFAEEALVDGLFAHVIDLVGDAGEVGVDAGHLEVVVDLVEQVAEGGGVAIAGADELGELGGELLLDGFFEHGAAHDGACGEEAEEVATGGFVKVAVGFFGAGRGDDTLTELGGAGDGRLDEFEEFKGEGGAEQVVLLGVEGTLNLLPVRRCGVGALEPGERGETVARVLHKALPHVQGELPPASDKLGGVLPVTLQELVVDDAGQDGAQLLEAIGPGELGDGVAELTAWRILSGHGDELVFEARYVDGHEGGSPISLFLG